MLAKFFKRLRYLTRSIVLASTCGLFFNFTYGSNELVQEHQRNERISELESVKLYAHVIQYLRQEYVERIDFRKLLEGALKGLTSTLDLDSCYFTADQYEDIQSHVEGRYGGLGIEIYIQEPYIRIISILPGGPAELADIHSGDFITAINNRSVSRFTAIEAQENLRGNPGSKITLLVRRKNNTIAEKVLNRALITTKSVQMGIRENIGYIRVLTFSKGSSHEIREAITRIQKKIRHQPSGLILDLRGNTGGLLEEAYETSSIFLDNLRVFSIKGSKLDKPLSFYSAQGDYMNNIPVILLINSGSASASEIVAGAIQDSGRGFVVGTKSFGKGSIQTVVPLQKGGAIKFTTANFFTPNGHSIHGRGIIPDLVVEQLIKAKSIDNLSSSHKDNNKLKKNKDSNSVDSVNSDEIKYYQGQKPGFLIESARIREDKIDFQLKQAINVLKTLILCSTQVQKTHVHCFH